ncbi:MAG: rhomboid family intramembrane serine protease [Paracoccaceae bacterium]
MTKLKPTKNPVAYDSHSVLNPISPILLIIAGAALLLEALFQLTDRGIVGGDAALAWRLEAIQTYGFFDSVFEHFRTNGLEAFLHQPALALSFFTYPFLHWSIPDALIGAAIFVAFGRMVSLRFSIWATLVLFVAGTFVAGLAFGIVSSSRQPMIGLFEPSCALIGGYCWTEYRFRKFQGEPVWPAFRILIFLAIFNVALYLFFEPRDYWVGQLAAFAAGFWLSYVLAPGAARRIVQRLRGG